MGLRTRRRRALFARLPFRLGVLSRPPYPQILLHSQKKWIYAAYRAFFQSDSGFQHDDNETAIFSFAKAVELDLKNKIFEPFKTVVRQELWTSAVTTDAAYEKRLIPLAKFVAKHKGKIMLGEMADSILASRELSKETAIKFRRWIEKHCPQTYTSGFTEKLFQLAEIAGKAKHSSTDNVKDAERLSREVLTMLVYDSTTSGEPS